MLLTGIRRTGGNPNQVGMYFPLRRRMKERTTCTHWSAGGFFFFVHPLLHHFPMGPARSGCEKRSQDHQGLYEYSIRAFFQSAGFASLFTFYFFHGALPRGHVDWDH